MTPRTRPSVAGALVAAIMLSGCVSVFPKTAPAQFYRFGATPGPQTPAASEARPSSGAAPPTLGPGPAAPSLGVVLEPVDLPRASTSDGILTVTGDQAAYLAGARWIAPARVLFQEALQRRLSAGDGGARLTDEADISARGFLKVSVTRFEADFADGGTPVIRLELMARMSARSGGAVDAVQIVETAAAKAVSVRAIVGAFDEVTGKAVDEVARFAGRAVQETRAAAGAVVTPPVP